MPKTVIVDNFTSIPKIFFPEGKEEPFCNCVMCDKSLLNNGTNYLIEKAYRQDLEKGTKEMIFEFVYCMDCLEVLRNEFSDESIQKLDAYFEQHVNFETRQENFTQYDLFETDLWLNNCVVKNKSIDEVDEFQIYALCNGGDMLFHHYPYMICGDAMDDVVHLISNKTLDIINDFWANHVDLPPEIEDIFKTTRPVIF